MEIGQLASVKAWSKDQDEGRKHIYSTAATAGQPYMAVVLVVFERGMSARSHHSDYTIEFENRLPLRHWHFLSYSSTLLRLRYSKLNEVRKRPHLSS